MNEEVKALLEGSKKEREPKCVVCGDTSELINKWHCSKECARYGYIRWPINDSVKRIEAIVITLASIQTTLEKMSSTMPK